MSIHIKPKHQCKDRENPSHYCPEWDYLYILPFTVEMDACICDFPDNEKVSYELPYTDKEYAGLLACKMDNKP